MTCDELAERVKLALGGDEALRRLVLDAQAAVDASVAGPESAGEFVHRDVAPLKAPWPLLVVAPVGGPAQVNRCKTPVSQANVLFVRLVFQEDSGVPAGAILRRVEAVLVASLNATVDGQQLSVRRGEEVYYPEQRGSEVWRHNGYRWNVTMRGTAS
jgi:hypothetical protein